MNENDKRQLQDAIKRNLGPMESSRIFLTLFSEGMEKDPLPVLQMGIAVMLDKPISLVVMKGAVVPEHLKKIAFAIEYADTPEETTAATMKILEKAKGMGL